MFLVLGQNFSLLVCMVNSRPPNNIMVRMLAFALASLHIAASAANVERALNHLAVSSDLYVTEENTKFTQIDECTTQMIEEVNAGSVHTVDACTDKCDGSDVCNAFVHNSETVKCYLYQMSNITECKAAGATHTQVFERSRRIAMIVTIDDTKHLQGTVAFVPLPSNADPPPHHLFVSVDTGRLTQALYQSRILNWGANLCSNLDPVHRARVHKIRHGQ